MKPAAPSLLDVIHTGLAGDLLAQLQNRKMRRVLTQWCSSILASETSKAPGILGELFAETRIQDIAREVFATSDGTPTWLEAGIDDERMFNFLIRVLGNPSNKLGTYGTLSPGECNHHIVKELRGQWLRGTTYGWMQPHGWGQQYGFLVMVFDPAGQPIPIHVLESPDLPEGFTRIDEFEGSEYQRVVLPIKLSNGALCTAQVYARTRSN